MIEEMIRMAMDARKKSYSPYSNFQVGVCLQTGEGKYYTGCNIENASYPATNCAERTAFFKAVSDGVKEFKRIVIVGGREKEELEICPPCGICRQVMAEFCDAADFEIILATSPEKYDVYLLKELLPLSFGGKLL